MSPVPAPVRRAVRTPWTVRPWRSTVHLAAGVPVGLAGTVVVALLAATTSLFLVAVVPAVPAFLLLLVAGRLLTGVQRARFAGTLDVRLAPGPPLSADAGWWAELRRVVRSDLTWRQLLYHLLAGVLGTFGFLVTLALWTFGIAASTVAVWGWWVLSDPSPSRLLAGTVLGLVAFHMAPWSAIVFANLDVVAARALLEPGARGAVVELSDRVRVLTDTRADAVAAADAERRRIERDLHDGAQQRLVSLAMNLGIARAGLGPDVPAPVRDALVGAHDEAKEVLVELRDLIRGLYPAMLDERGLDAALSGIAARSPVPVRLSVDLPRRPSRTTEAVAYFVVSEALTNVAKHASASRVDVRVRCRDHGGPGGTVGVVVADDGRGGARIEGSSGLRGLAQRVGAVDGTLSVDSPAGGPTVLAAELPCGW